MGHDPEWICALCQACTLLKNLRRNSLSNVNRFKDSRAARLSAILDERYVEFAEGLPRPLRDLAQLRSTFTGSPGDEPFEGVSSLLAGPVGTHWLFWEVFCGLDDELFLDIAEAGTFLVLASLVLDNIVDGQVGHANATVLFHNALREHGAARFRAALPPTSAFWTHYDRLTANHLAGLAAELVGRSAPQQYTLEQLHRTAHGKVSPCVTTIAALAAAGGQPAILKPIETSLKHLSSAFQLLDDVEDWEHDFETGNLTYFLSQLAPAEAWLLPDWPSADELGACLAADWKDVEHIRKAKEWLNEAIEAVDDLDCPRWKHYVSSFQALADQHMTQAIARHLSRAIQPLVDRAEE